MEELDDEEEDEESELLSPGPSLWETLGSHSPLSSGMSLVMPSVQVPASIARGRFLSLMVWGVRLLDIPVPLGLKEEG